MCDHRSTPKSIWTLFWWKSFLVKWKTWFFLKQIFPKHGISKTKLENFDMKIVLKSWSNTNSVCVTIPSNLPLSSRFWQNHLKIKTKKKITNLEFFFMFDPGALLLCYAWGSKSFAASKSVSLELEPSNNLWFYPETYLNKIVKKHN